MNKLRGKILLIIIICTIMVLPKNAYAVSKKVAKKECQSIIDINITPDKYKRSAGFSNGRYWNDVKSRNITITVTNPKTYKYRLIIFKGDYGSLENATSLTKEGIGGVNAEKTSEILTDETTTYEVPAGKEVIVIVLQEEDVTTSITQGKKTVDITCEHGELKKSASDAYDIELTGTAASAFVQNPDATSTILQNLRSYDNGGEACKNAKEGKHTKNDTFSLTNEPQAVKDTWFSEYYSKILRYCKTNEVPFNLDDSEIEKVSNKLLKMYYYIRNGSTGTSVADVTKSMNDLKSQVDDYYIYNSTDPSKSDGKNTNSANIRDQKLYCEYDSANMEYDTNNHTGKYKAGSGQKSYLYAETSSQFATLVAWNDETNQVEAIKNGNDGKVKVCDSTCYEHLTVVYSPPQTVKAGLCFQYRVTVKSKVECGVDYNTDNLLNKLNDVINSREMCSALPACDDNATKTQAGPSQDFDNCVNSCDNGQYSQKCINKCYDKVYKNKYDIDSSKTKTTSAITKTQDNITTPVIYDNSSSSLVKLTVEANPTDKNYENYYKNDICKNGDIYDNGFKEDNLEKCAKFYYKAKTLYPMGHFKCPDGNDETEDKTECKWIKDNEVADPANQNNGIEDIGMQIARAAPFYVRDVETTKDLIKGFFAANGNFSKKYYINTDGVKTQRSKNGTWECPMKCSFYGCSKDNALTSKQYTNGIKASLDNINDALQKCKTSSACDTTETTTNFDIKINSQNGNSQSSTGHTDLHKNTGSDDSNMCDITNQDGPKPSMFIPAFENDPSEEGIFGQCYDDNNIKDLGGNPIDYQTTITFPGTLINLKTGELSYECKKEGYRNKSQFVCTTYDAAEVNKKWWDWAVVDKYAADKYPTDFTPSSTGATIDANLGTNTKGFGKYNWHINLSCFYSVYNKTTDGPNCYRGDEGNREDCPPDTDKQDGNDISTVLNYDIRVVSLDNMFPNNRLRGYNWGSSAKLSAPNDEAVAAKLKASGYDVDPVDYSRSIIPNSADCPDCYGKGESGTYTDENLDFRIILDTDDINDLKALSLEFGGKFEVDKEIIPGLYAYNMYDRSMSHDNFASIGTITTDKFRNNRGKNNIK